MHKLSLIIINYNSFNHLLNLLKSLRLIGNLVNEIIIIDNASKKFDRSFFKNQKNTKIIFNKRNVGFARAMNQGIIIAKNPIILSLNPDTIIIDKSICKMFQTIKDDSDIGIIGGKINDMYSNKIRYSATRKPTFLTGLFEFTNLKKIFPNNYFSKQFWVESKPSKKKLLHSDSICGAFIMFRKYINKKLNLFDPNYTLYFEDVDFGIKNRTEGYKVYLYQFSTIKHIGGASSNNKYRTNLKYWYKSRKYFFRKHSTVLSSYILDKIYTIEEKFLKFYHNLRNEPSY